MYCALSLQQFSLCPPLYRFDALIWWFGCTRIKLDLNGIASYRITYTNISIYHTNSIYRAALVLGHHPFVLWSAAYLTLLHLTESGQRVYISEYFPCSVDLSYPVRFCYLPLKQWEVQFDNKKCYLSNDVLLMCTPTTTLNLPLQ